MEWKGAKDSETKHKLLVCLDFGRKQSRHESDNACIGEGSPRLLNTLVTNSAASMPAEWSENLTLQNTICLRPKAKHLNFVFKGLIGKMLTALQHSINSKCSERFPTFNCSFS